MNTVPDEIKIAILSIVTKQLKDENCVLQKELRTATLEIKIRNSDLITQAKKYEALRTAHTKLTRLMVENINQYEKIKTNHSNIIAAMGRNHLF